MSVDCAGHGVVVHPAVHLALLFRYLHRVGLRQQVGDVLLHPRVFRPVAESGLGDVVGGADGRGEALADGVAGGALILAGNQLRADGGVGHPLQVDIDAHRFPVAAHRFAGLHFGGGAANGRRQGDGKAVGVARFRQQLPRQVGVIFVSPARVGLGIVAHPVPQIQRAAKAGKQLVDDFLPVDGVEHRLLHLDGVLPFLGFRVFVAGHPGVGAVQVGVGFAVAVHAVGLPVDVQPGLPGEGPGDDLRAIHGPHGVQRVEVHLHDVQGAGLEPGHPGGLFGDGPHIEVGEVGGFAPVVLHRLKAPDAPAVVGNDFPGAGGGDVLAGLLGALQILVGGGVVDVAAARFHQLLGLLPAGDAGADAAEVPHKLEGALLQPGFAGVDDDGIVVDHRLAAAGLADPKVADDAGAGVQRTLVPFPVVPQDVLHRQVAVPLMELHIVADAPGPVDAVGGNVPTGGQQRPRRKVGLNGDHTLAERDGGILDAGAGHKAGMPLEDAGFADAVVQHALGLIGGRGGAGGRRQRGRGRFGNGGRRGLPGLRRGRGRRGGRRGRPGLGRRRGGGGRLGRHRCSRAAAGQQQRQQRGQSRRQPVLGVSGYQAKHMPPVLSMSVASPGREGNRRKPSRTPVRVGGRAGRCAGMPPAKLAHLY